MENKSAPEGYATITPNFVVNDAEAFIDFIEKVFDAEERYIMKTPNGHFLHAEYMIGNSAIMIGEVTEQWDKKINSLYVYVPDVDETYQKALNAGAESLMEVEDQFYGDRVAAVMDPFGNFWNFATNVRDVSEEEMAEGIKAFDEAMG